MTKALVSPSAASDTPLYQRLVDSLRSAIVTGVHPVGGLLPTEGALSDRFGVSRHTVREALRQLRDEGLVASRQGSGTTVVSAAPIEHFVHEVASINDLIAYAQELRYEVESSAILVAEAALATRLNCLPGQRWLRIEGYRHIPGHALPSAWTEVFIHADFAGVAINFGRRPGPIYLWIEEMYSTSVQAVEQVITGRPVPAPVAKVLMVEEGSAGIEVKRTYRLSGGACALVASTLHPADRFTHSMTLRRARPQA